ncbi:hypothetical protein HK102_008883 [Quaeritorhiza haematococci]|nr:hypothetical protein HK102_008883 [Quaeritorhiza haematococci]
MKSITIVSTILASLCAGALGAPLEARKDKVPIPFTITSAPKVIAEQAYAFAHEGPVYVPQLDSVFFTSNRLFEDPANPQSPQRIEIGRIQLSDNSLSLNLPIDIPLPNGAVLSPRGTILVCGQGSFEVPAGLYEFDPVSLESRPIVTSFANQSFNSPNDVIVDNRGFVWFTDPTYGFVQGFRPEPTAEARARGLYRGKYNRETGDITDLVPFPSDLFVKPNGVTISPDGRRLFIADSGFAIGNGQVDPTAPRSVFVFDLENDDSTPGALRPVNGRVLAVIDNGVPDGIKFDRSGKFLLVGSGDGVRAYNPESGELLGTVLIPEGVANFEVVPGDGQKGRTRLITMSEKRIYEAYIR